MKRAKGDKYDAFVSLTSQRSLQILLGVGILYIVLVTVEIPYVSQETQSFIPRSVKLQTDQDLQTRVAPPRPQVDVSSATEAGKGVELSPATVSAIVPRRSMVSGLNFENAWKSRGTNGFWGLHKYFKVAWGGEPRGAHVETEPRIALVKDGVEVMVSQFHMELQGLRTVEGEDPPRILHFNPRMKGDRSGKPVMEQNNCYRMQWGNALCCEGWKSRADEGTVDGQLKCEK